MADPTLEEITAALYAGPLDAFVTSRRARAEAVSDSGLASKIRALRKPSIAAWVVNVFAQERAVQLGEALHLAQELREAQDDLDAPALAKLGRERRVLTRRLAAAAAELAASRGEPVTSATLEAVELSISAAFFDPVAAGAIASGRLLRALAPASTPSDIRDAVAGDIPAQESVSPRPSDELQARRVRREAERQVAAAEKARVAAERELTMQDAALQELYARATELSDRAAELELQLAQIRADAARVATQVPVAVESRAAASARVDAAVHAVDLATRDHEGL